MPSQPGPPPDLSRIPDPHASAAEARRFQAFLAEFDVLLMPACDTGMRLLLRLRDTQPEAFRLAGEYAWAYTDDPRLTHLPEWQAFANHYNACEACNAC